jgi:group II intron reverse transcriptase/maturase
MQKAEVVLGVLRERGRKGLPCDELYRQMFNKDLYRAAYGEIYSNKGAMTPGVDGESADGMSEAEIDRIIGLMRQEKYRFSPARRVYIPKKNGKLRPLSMPTWDDKLVGQVVRMLLEAHYEPQFSGSSHGFRKGRGCHTALRDVQDHWTGTAWFIEADISDCFGQLDHEVMLSILAERIRDNRFLRLIGNMLRAGYLEEWEYRETPSGTPQGGIVSPVLSNIYLHKLDDFVERELIPRHTRGKARTWNPEYARLKTRRTRAKERGNRAQARELLLRMRGMPRNDPSDPGYRRLRYIRYADDELLGFSGPKAEAEDIREELAEFLRDNLRLELNQDKTLITHARTQRARFLGYDINVQHGDARLYKDKRRPHGYRSVNGKVALRVPPDVIRAKCAPYRRHGKPWHRERFQNLDDYDIVRIYGAEYRGIVNYYLLATNVSDLNALRWNSETSMLKTLAAKHHSTVGKTAARYKAKVDTSHGKRTCFEAVRTRAGRKDLIARFGGIPLKRDKRAAIRDPGPAPVHAPQKELVRRLRKRYCELCEQRGTVAVHQITRLAALGKPGPGQPAWAALMARMRRKTLIVCAACHEYIHANPNARAA